MGQTKEGLEIKMLKLDTSAGHILQVNFPVVVDSFVLERGWDKDASQHLEIEPQCAHPECASFPFVECDES